MMAVLAVFCISAVAAAAASASEGELVSTSTKKALTKNKFTGTSAETELRGATTIKCKADKATGVITSATGGEMTVTFTGCTALSLPCKGGTATNSGEIITLVGLLVKRLAGQTKDTILTLVLANGTKTAGELAIECSGVKIKVKGSFLSVGITQKASSSTYTLEGKGTGKKQEPLEYENEAKTLVKNTLESNVEGGTFEASAEVGVEKVTFEEAAEFL